MLFFCKAILLAACPKSLPDMMKKIRRMWVLLHARAFNDTTNSSLVASLQMSSPRSHQAVSERSVSFCRACVNSETHTVILEIVPAQFCLRIRNTLQEWAEEYKRRELNLCSLPVVGEETANPNIPVWKKYDGWHRLQVPESEVPHK